MLTFKISKSPFPIFLRAGNLQSSCYLRHILTVIDIFFLTILAENSNKRGEIDTNGAKSPALTQICMQENVEFFMKYWEAPPKNGRVDTYACNEWKTPILIKIFIQYISQ